jgi:hypothetical protein
MNLDDLAPEPTLATYGAREVAREFLSAALLDHCERSYLWAASHGRADGISFDAELLFVAAILHDLGLTATFDSVSVAFETAGGNVAWVFGAGSGWSVRRRARVREVIERHMGQTPSPEKDPEGHLLNLATGFDISGRHPELWPGDLRRSVLERYPRGDLAEEFACAFEAQAGRKPTSAAAQAVRNGIRQRLAANPLERKR